MNMAERCNKLILRSALMLGAVYIILYIIDLIFSMVLSIDILWTIARFLRQASYLLLPMAALIISLSVSVFSSIRRGILSLLLFSGLRFLYIFPYFLSYYYINGAESWKLILLSFGFGILECGLLFGITVLSFLIFSRLAFHKKDTVKVKNDLLDLEMFNFGNKINLGVFVLAGVAFLYYFVDELIRTISFLLTSGGIYSPTEIIYLIITYLFILALLFIFHLILFFTKTRTSYYLSYSSDGK